MPIVCKSLLDNDGLAQDKARTSFGLVRCSLLKGEPAQQQVTTDSTHHADPRPPGARMDTRLEEIKARAQAATPGPWETDERYPARVYCDDILGSCIADCTMTHALNLTTEDFKANADFIAHARSDMDYLTARLTVLAGVIRDISEATVTHDPEAFRNRVIAILTHGSAAVPLSAEAPLRALRNYLITGICQDDAACIDQACAKADRMLDELRAALLAARRGEHAARDRIAEHEAIFRWLLGEEGEFPESLPGKRYNFRTELRQRLAALAATLEEKC